MQRGKYFPLTHAARYLLQSDGYVRRESKHEFVIIFRMRPTWLKHATLTGRWFGGTVWLSPAICRPFINVHCGRPRRAGCELISMISRTLTLNVPKMCPIAGEKNKNRINFTRSFLHVLFLTAFLSDVTAFIAAKMWEKFIQAGIHSLQHSDNVCYVKWRAVCKNVKHTACSFH